MIDLRGKTEQALRYVGKVATPVVHTVAYTLTGDVLVKRKFLKQLPFLVFLLMLSRFYVNNRFSYEAELRELNKLKSEMVDKRYRSLTISKELMEMGRQSRIEQRLKRMGSELQDARTPLIMVKE